MKIFIEQENEQYLVRKEFAFLGFKWNRYWGRRFDSNFGSYLGWTPKKYRHLFNTRFAAEHFRGSSDPLINAMTGFDKV